MKNLLNLFVLIFLAFAALGCNRDDSEKVKDPVIGKWNLRAVFVNGETADVTNVKCFQDSYLNFSAKEVEMKTSVPNEQNTSCQTSVEKYSWSNSNGTYYVSQNGQQQPAGIKLNDNNETLQLDLSADGNTVYFLYRK
ncbi:lipocalin family protein [Chryseobacterium taklimakanense]|uniref:lipocalin family protein n=1 Tax=Chryseobacterium taklimakanense TaxID=536441 RepID=UPI001EF3F54B|nr:lipocalin family protein [Chryseobacterium taklimakanense]MCG7280768.1 lipocalin family protein [Chryseobacterium taklimakanense]